MADLKCPRCGTTMRWLKRRNIFFCDYDGYILGPNDPFVTRGEIIPPHNPGGQHNK